MQESGFMFSDYSRVVVMPGDDATLIMEGSDSVPDGGEQNALILGFHFEEVHTWLIA